jgi:hypothetical protein
MMRLCSCLLLPCYLCTDAILSRKPILRLDCASQNQNNIPQMKANAYTQTEVTEFCLTPGLNIFANCQPDLARLLQQAAPCQATAHAPDARPVPL